MAGHSIKESCQHHDLYDYSVGDRKKARQGERRARSALEQREQRIDACAIRQHRGSGHGHIEDDA
jgi:hypothetical protein